MIIAPTIFACSAVTLVPQLAGPSSPSSAPVDVYTQSGARVQRNNDAMMMVGMGLIALTGGAIGIYAGLHTGALAGLADAVAGGSMGAAIPTMVDNESTTKRLVGGILGLGAGAYLGAAVASPFAAVALGIAGLCVPFGLMSLSEAGLLPNI